MLLLKSYPTTALLIALLASACDSGRPEGAVASVENQWLTLRDLRYPGDLDASEAVENWVDDQVLLHHALRSDGSATSVIDLADRFALRLRARAFLDSLVRARIQITDSLIAEHYRDNPEISLSSVASAHIVHIGFFKQADANEARARLLPVTSSMDSLWLDYNRDEKWLLSGRLHPQLEQQIFSAPLRRLVGPVPSDFGFHLIFVQQRYNAGDQIPLKWVKEKVYQSLLLQAWPAAESAVLDSLREETNFEIISD